VPFYDYICQACGRRIEVMHGVHASGPDRCDACGGQLRRAISRPAIHFKGSGWAKMDARAQAVRTGAGTPRADAPPEDGPRGASGEPAAEDRAEAKATSGGTSEPSSAAGPPADGGAERAAKQATRKGTKSADATRDGARAASTGPD